ncbi:MAG: hypothetical protein L6420_11160 [Elusimicrobia bacterium]|nr:hypothetical protein [Elusimicrobiota bacterium]
MKKIIGMFLMAGICGSVAMAQGVPSALENFEAVAGEQDSISIPAPTLSKSLPGVNAQVLTYKRVKSEIVVREEALDTLCDTYLYDYDPESSEYKAFIKVATELRVEVRQLRAMLTKDDMTIPSIQQVAEMKAEIPNLERKIVNFKKELTFRMDQLIETDFIAKREILMRIAEISIQIKDVQGKIDYIKSWL